jgi:superkiller protein 3
LEKAAQLGSNDAAGFANLGWAYYNAARADARANKSDSARRNTELARQNLEKAVALGPSFIEGPLLNLGMARTDLGDYSGAIDALEKVVKKQPNWAFAWNELGIAYRKKENYKKAIDQYKRATEIDDRFAAAWYNLGEAAIKLDNMGEARRAYQKLVALGQNNFANSLLAMSKGAVRN